MLRVLFRTIAVLAVSTVVGVVGYLAIASDPEFNALHADPRFQTLVSYARERAASLQKPK